MPNDEIDYCDFTVSIYILIFYPVIKIAAITGTINAAGTHGHASRLTMGIFAISVSITFACRGNWIAVNSNGQFLKSNINQNIYWEINWISRDAIDNV